MGKVDGYAVQEMSTELFRQFGGDVSGLHIDEETVKYEQLKYGVPVVQPAYGVPVVQPKYGVIYDPTIDITYDQLEENISTLKKSISTLKDAWTNQTKKNIATLDNSWVGPDCAAYTAKLKGMDTKVENTISALELLCSTYEKARDMVSESQKAAVSSIEGS